MLVEVAAALIWREDEKLLICQRPAHKARGLLWEFPGGKREAGETLEACLIRECKEELGVTLAVGALFTHTTHAYTDLTVSLFIFDAQIVSGVLQKLEHNDLRWVEIYELSDFTFCPADQEVLLMLEKRGRIS